MTAQIYQQSWYSYNKEKLLTAQPAITGWSAQVRH